MDDLSYHVTKIVTEEIGILKDVLISVDGVSDKKALGLLKYYVEREDFLFPSSNKELGLCHAKFINDFREIEFVSMGTTDCQCLHDIWSSVISNEIIRGDNANNRSIIEYITLLNHASMINRYFTILINDARCAYMIENYGVPLINGRNDVVIADGGIRSDGTFLLLGVRLNSVSKYLSLPLSAYGLKTTLVGYLRYNGYVYDLGIKETPIENKVITPNNHILQKKRGDTPE